MNYVKLLLAALSIHLTTQATTQWTPFSFTTISAQGEPLYYNQPHISLAPAQRRLPAISAAPVIAVPSALLNAHTPLQDALQKISPTTPTHIPHLTTTAPVARTNILRLSDLFTHHNKTAAIAAIHGVINKRHLQRKMDAESFQALMNNPILAYTRSWAARTLKQPAITQLQQQSLHNARSGQPSARL